jgi:hypothetical protein
MSDQTQTIPARGNIAYDASAALALTNSAQHTLANARTFAVDSPEMLEAAAEDLRTVKTLQKRVEDQRTAITGPLNAALKAVNDLFRPAGEYLKQAETVLKGSMLVYTAEQERIAEEARRAAEAAAAAERARLAAIQREQDEAARKATEAAERAAQEAIAKANAAAQAGDFEAAAAAHEAARHSAEVAQQAQAQAEATAMTAAVVAMPVAAEPAAKAKGISTSTSVDFTVTDKLALLRHIAAHPELLDLMAVDSVKLRAQVRATGMNTNLPGVTVFAKRTMAARAA